MSSWTGPHSQSSETEDLIGFLDYFENHRKVDNGLLRSGHRANPAPEHSIAATEVWSEKLPSAPPPDSGPPGDPDEQFPVLTSGWKGIRRSPCDLDLLLTLQEPQDTEFRDPDYPSLLEDKIEREVAQQLSTHPRDEQDAYRKLLRRFPNNISRASIRKLIEQGRTPRQIRLAAKIRRRCESLVSEFNRIDLWGPKFTSTLNCTVSWQLADRLRMAGIHTRLELFQFFQQLTDQLTTSKSLRRQFYGAFHLAENMLPQRTVVSCKHELGVCTRAKDLLPRAGLREIWKWQNPLANALSRRGLPLRAAMPYTIVEEPGEPTFFVEYRCSRNLPPVDTDSMETISQYFLLRLVREGPLSLSLIRGLCKAAFKGREKPPTPSQLIGRISDKVTWVGHDLWYYRDRPRLGRLPRKAHPGEGPTVVQATDYDLGLGFEQLQKRFPSKTTAEIELELLRLWRSDARELLTVQAAVRRYQENYGKMEIHP